MIVTNIVSLDGYYEGPGANAMALPMDPSFDEHNAERLRAADTLLLGRKSYEGFKGFWPGIADDPDATPIHREISRLHDAIDKVVVSDSITADQTDPFGSRTLWNDVLTASLVDELHLMVGSVVLGDGTPAFRRRAGRLAATARHADVGRFGQRARPVRRRPVLVTRQLELVHVDIHGDRIDVRGTCGVGIKFDAPAVDEQGQGARPPTPYTMSSSSTVNDVHRIGAAIQGVLPRGQALPADAWARRHRAMLWILWAHVPALLTFSLLRGSELGASLASMLPIALAGGAAMLERAGRRARSVAVVFGLLTASAVLVHAWDGQIEAHFHFFVMIAVLALYEDGLPFGLAVAYVVAEHGVLGAIAPDSVYNHGGSPWGWAVVHGLFVLGAVSASVVTWRLNEDMRARMGEAHVRERETSERFQFAFESGVSGMAIAAPDGRFLKVNRALCEMTGHAAPALLALDFQSITHPEDLVADLDQQRAMLDGVADVYETEKRYLHRDGHEVWVEVGVTAVRGEDGRVQYFISQSHDVTTRRRFEEELAHRALHDPLTGLPNRALFVDRLRHALVRLRRRSGEIAVLFVDLDRFKLVNDGMGHVVGDAVLLEAASRLSATARAEDTVARFGGDEFTILCEDASEEEAHLVAERILAAFAEPFEHDDREFHLTASVGIRVTDEASATPDSLLRDADIALYAAKEHGRARAEVFDSQSRMHGIDPLATEQALRLAMRRGELCLQYQPEVDLATSRIVAVEALVRWQHPERGLVAPGEFIPVAEQSGLIVPLGEWVLREACRQLSAWRCAGTVADDVRVAVNVSARQLSDPQLPLTVAAALSSAELDPEALCLEITESAVIQDAELALANVHAIKRQGVCVALDDFGVGFSSLSQIRELPPVDMIKVDRSFTAGLGRNDSDGAVVAAVLTLARSLGLTAVAEGVETVEQIELLRGLGCDVGQGFHFSRPQAPDEIERLLRADAAPTMAAGPAGDPRDA